MNRLWCHNEDSLLLVDLWYSSIFEKCQVRPLYQFPRNFHWNHLCQYLKIQELLSNCDLTDFRSNRLILSTKNLKWRHHQEFQFQFWYNSEIGATSKLIQFWILTQFWNWCNFEIDPILKFWNWTNFEIDPISKLIQFWSNSEIGPMSDQFQNWSKIGKLAQYIIFWITSSIL